MDDSDPGPPPARARTIVELARLAGVSPGTVSRALAEKPVVNAATAARIRMLAAEHDFRLNQMASRLRTRRTGVIGVAVPLGHERRQHLSDPFFMTMIGYLADALTENGYDLMLSRVIPDAPDWLERLVDSGMLDGILLLGQSDQWEAIERVAARYRRLVAWGVSKPGQVHCAVGTDNRLGGRLAGEQLLAGGARRIAFLGDARAPELRDRFNGLADALAVAGAPPPQLWETHLSAEIMAPEIAAHLDRATGAIDGILAGSDVIALSALRALADHRLAVPDAVQVVGYDDLPIATQAVPRLTTVAQDFAAGAAAMVERLFARIAGAESASLRLAPRLVTRDSTRAGSDPSP